MRRRGNVAAEQRVAGWLAVWRQRYRIYPDRPSLSTLVAHKPHEVAVPGDNVIRCQEFQLL